MLNWIYKKERVLEFKVETLIDKLKSDKPEHNQELFQHYLIIRLNFHYKHSKTIFPL